MLDAYSRLAITGTDHVSAMTSCAAEVSQAIGPHGALADCAASPVVAMARELDQRRQLAAARRA
jgi:hypothetical protein